MGHTATVDHLHALARDSGGPHVSIYLPGDSPPGTIEALIRQARAHLRKCGWPDRFLADLNPEDMTTKHDHSTAAFAAPGWHSWFPVPFAVRPQAVVTESFHVKPVLPLLTGYGRFHILALSGSGVRLFEATREDLREVITRELAATPQQVLAYDRLEQQRAWHIAGHAGSHGRVISHGHGVGDELRKEHLHQYLVHVARALPSAVPAGEPLVLAGVSYLQSMFRQSWPRAIPESVVGSVEHMPTDELHARALSCVRSHERRGRHATAEGFEVLRGTDLATTRLGAILQAAQLGRIDTLWVTLDEECWGTPNDPNACEPEPGEGTEDLLNLAATRTLLAGGRVYAVPGEDVPEGGQAAAVLRY